MNDCGNAASNKLRSNTKRGRDARIATLKAMKDLQQILEGHIMQSQSDAACTGEDPSNRTELTSHELAQEKLYLQSAM